MTQLLSAKAGVLTDAMERVAVKEQVSPQFVLEGVAAGTIVIPANKRHLTLDPVGIGKGVSTKINANIGTSTSFPDIEKELLKLRVVLEAGAQAVMDLSTGGEIDRGRRRIIEESTIPVGTVPIYQAFLENRERRGNMLSMTADDLFEVVERHCSDGADFITVHCGVTLEVLRSLKEQGRITDIVSRGGSFLTGWMLHHGKENPLYEQFDRLLDICLKYDVTLSLGDGLRPGCLADATDRAQIQELILLGELVDRARDRGVQAMVEGPGHVPLDQIPANIQIQKTICKGAPFYVLGPLVTDIAPGYDHITAAIGGTVAAAAGADFLCYVTPAEHLGLPTLEDVREGVMASRLAAHAADIVKGIPGALEWDIQMARARKSLDWEKQIELSLDPVKAARIRRERNPHGHEACTMCGDFCAMKIVANFLQCEPEGC